MSEPKFSHVYALVRKGRGPWEVTFQDFKEVTKDPGAAKVAAYIAKEGKGRNNLWSKGGRQVIMVVYTSSFNLLITFVDSPQTF